MSDTDWLLQPGCFDERAQVLDEVENAVLCRLVTVAMASAIERKNVESGAEPFGQRLPDIGDESGRMDKNDVRAGALPFQVAQPYSVRREKPFAHGFIVRRYFRVGPRPPLSAAAPWPNAALASSC